MYAFFGHFSNVSFYYSSPHRPRQPVQPNRLYILQFVYKQAAPATHTTNLPNMPKTKPAHTHTQLNSPFRLALPYQDFLRARTLTYTHTGRLRLVKDILAKLHWPSERVRF